MLLTLRRGDEAASIPWFGTARTVPLPAGVAVCSPWLDVSQSSPSWKASHSQATAFDYLPPAPDPTSRSDLFFRRLPPCAAWPPDPKVGSRSSIYAPRDGLLAHPLVSPALATDWTGAPPLWIACGWERIADECRYLAAKMARDIDASAAAAAERSASISSRVEPGIRRTSSGRGRRRAAAAGSGSANGTTTTTITTTTTKTKKAQPPPPQPSSQASSVVRLEQYEAMPHAFGLIMRRTDGAPWRCNERWAKFISACVEAPETLREQKQQRSKGHCEFITFAARSLTESVRPLSEASTVDEASFRREVAARIDALVKGRMEIEEEKRQKESRGRKALSVCW